MAHCGGTDIRGLFARPRTLSLRRVCVFLRHLPSGAALARRGAAGKLPDPAAVRERAQETPRARAAPLPSLTENLLAQVVNQIRVLDWHTRLIATDAKGRRSMSAPELLSAADLGEDG